MTDPGKKKNDSEELSRKLDEHLAEKYGDFSVLSDPVDGDYWFKAPAAVIEEKA